MFFSGNDVFFEGAEKVVEMWFQLPSMGLRLIKREEWDIILDKVGAQIVATSSNNQMDSYVLSESSLFVWSDHLVLKTCGKTTVLLACQLVSDYISQYFEDVSPYPFQLFYSHKEFLRQDEQEFPHQSLAQEHSFMMEYVPTGKWFNYFYNGDKLSHWTIFIYQKQDIQLHPCIKNDITTEISMYGLCQDRAEYFVRSKFDNPDTDVVVVNKINHFIPGCKIDHLLFDPYGYSVNGYLDHDYFTIHVTPQPSCSYASYETNVQFPDLYRSISLALDIFKPEHFSITIVTNQNLNDDVTKLFDHLNKIKPSKTVTQSNFNSYSITYSWF